MECLAVISGGIQFSTACYVGLDACLHGDSAAVVHCGHGHDGEGLEIDIDREGVGDIYRTRLQLALVNFVAM